MSSESTAAVPTARRRRWLWLLVAGFAVAALVIGRPLLFLARTAWLDRDERRPPPAGTVQDASRMQATPVAEVWEIPLDAADPEGQLRALLARARREHLRVSIAGARHSLGGHTVYPGGIVINMLPWKQMQLDTERDILTVQSGAIWADIIPYLDAQGRAVAIMQSDHDFSVGGSISVNCHGWQAGRPPIASSVDAFRIMLADGSIRRCSRSKNSELFAHALGGYGLFGIILDVDLRVIPNAAYTRRRQVLPTAELPAIVAADIFDHPEIQMAYGRLCVDPDRLFDDWILTTCTLAPGVAPPALQAPEISRLRRTVFRGSEGSDYGKRLRWDAESRYEARVHAEAIVSRNQLMHTPTDEILNHHDASTDILHEYFIPPERSLDFLDAARPIVRRHGADLLNVTVRFVEPDPDTALRYADRRMCAFVMLFSQPRNEAGDAAMQALTRELIDAALAVDGRYYLPYRLHASQAQFDAAYPQAAAFFAVKRRYDPEGLFQNRFYQTYGQNAIPEPPAAPMP